jgi:hypothetical protein
VDVNDSQTTTSGIPGEGRTWCVAIDISQHDSRQVDHEDIIPRQGNIFKMRKVEDT